MKNIVSTIALVLLCLSAITACNAQDYSAYSIAKSYYSDHKYIFAYKFLIIFKTTNLDRLNKPENRATLNALDKEISDLEDLLTQNLNWYSIKSAKGWSDRIVTDSLKNAYTTLKLGELKIE
jgi:hypothetical protein